MKKRASRFGGVEGVNGPTVTAANMHVLEVEASGAPRDVSGDQESEPLKRWRTLDEIASLDRRRNDAVPAEDIRLDESKGIASKDSSMTENKLSSAPILDFICRRRGEHQLSRMASMPSLASLLASKEDKTKPSNTKKDLRDLLPCKNSSSRPELYRSNSASTLLLRVGEADTLAEEDRPKVKTQGRERCYSLQMKNDGHAMLGGPFDTKEEKNQDRCTMVAGKISFPSLFVESLQKQNLLVLAQSRKIWQKMESSSSSSEGCLGSPDSNKENRDPRDVSRRDEQGEDEDEERTLRRIAGRRAAKDLAKKEEKLSREGKRYLQEADARIALQQRKRSNDTQSRQSGKEEGSTRTWNRATSDAQLLQKNRTILSRVPSLDMTAGRDRSKDDERPSYSSLFEMRMAKRSYQNSISQDENAIPTSIPARSSTLQSNKRSRYNSLRQATQPSILQASQKGVARRPDHTLLRRFAPSQSLPSSTATSLLSTRLNSAFPPFFPVPTRFESARESSARLDGAKQGHSLPSSQESSENGSDDWLEAWAQEKRGGQKSPSRGNVLKERSIFVNKDQRGVLRESMAKQPLPRHDDSGFYGSDSVEEEEEEGGGVGEHGNLAGKGGMKRRLVNPDSSSPSKRGDERDRLAAETLLGLGSRS